MEPPHDQVTHAVARRRLGTATLIASAATLSDLGEAAGTRSGAINAASAFSTALGERIDYNVYLPDGYSTSTRRHPVLYLLHGRGHTMAAWTQVKSRLDQMIRDRIMPPVIAIMPDAPWSERGSWYVDSAYTATDNPGRPVETAFTRDLVNAVDATYRTIAIRNARMIGGYSMGGAGALRFALAHQDVFGSALMLSPAIYTPLPPTDSNSRICGGFGCGESVFDDEVYRQLNYPALLPSVDPDLPLHLFIAVGDDEYANPDPANARHDLDFESANLYNAVRRVPGINAHMRILEGGHDWGVWAPAFAQGMAKLGPVLGSLPPTQSPPLAPGVSGSGTPVQTPLRSNDATSAASGSTDDRPHRAASPAPAPPAASSPLGGVKVVELATLFAGPLSGAFLSDFGADVLKVEHPSKPDASRGHGPSKDGVGLWWKVLGRNKRTITLDLSRVDGADVLRRLLADADVVIENFRPGTLEKWGIGPKTLLANNPRLVIARVSGFGQVGPYARRPGFGTLAEAMSGFAAATGEPDGPPTLPPFGLADSIAALATAFAVNLALTERARSGRGQVIDVAIIEPIMAMLGPQITWYDQLGYVQPRLGNRSANNAPRNTYRCSDGRWVAVSTSAQTIADRVMRLVGRPDVVDEPWFASGTTRAAHADELDSAVAAWVADRTRPEVVAAFEEAEAAVAPVYDISDIMSDPQYLALGTAVTIDDPDLGHMRMQNVPFRLSATPGSIRFAGRPHGADTDAVLTEIGLTMEQINGLRASGVV